MNKYKKNSDISSHTNNVIRYTEIMIIIFTSKLPCFKTQIKQPVSKLKKRVSFLLFGAVKSLCFRLDRIDER